MIPVILGHNNDGGSVQTLLYVGQLFNSRGFTKFDYGGRKNRAVYGSSIPPEYNLKNVEAKIVVHYVKNDGVLLGKNVERVIKQLPNVISVHLIPDNQFTHTGYTTSTKAQPLLYDNLINSMKLADNS